MHQTAAHLETDEVTYSHAFGFLTDDEPIETSSLLKQAEEKGRLVYDTYGAFVLAACPVIAMGDIFGFIVALKKKRRGTISMPSPLSMPVRCMRLNG